MPKLDEAGVQYGDIQKFQALQAAAKTPADQVRSAPGKAQPVVVPTGPNQIPPFVFDMPSKRPAEPVTAGLPMGPGPGPEALQAQPDSSDIRELTLQYLALNFGNTDATQMLQQYRQ